MLVRHILLSLAVWSASSVAIAIDLPKVCQDAVEADVEDGATLTSPTTPLEDGILLTTLSGSYRGHYSTILHTCHLESFQMRSVLVTFGDPEAATRFFDIERDDLLRLEGVSHDGPEGSSQDLLDEAGAAGEGKAVALQAFRWKNDRTRLAVILTKVDESWQVTFAKAVEIAEK